VSRDPLLYLEDICERCGYILEFTANITYEAFRTDRMRVDAVARNLEIIGEAARCLSQSVRDATPGVAWADIIGMRNILAHAYFGADSEILWSAATEKVEHLMNTVQSFLRDNAT
jgi:uncharacterized protein with HEPN domain